jgi:hypothetical protein
VRHTAACQYATQFTGHPVIWLSFLCNYYKALLIARAMLIMLPIINQHATTHHEHHNEYGKATRLII